ncbi:hypothetical protein GCM10010421_53500 [Streptomyces glaucus]|uniref:Secreted protein n=1 Tax=Streptomyces glaucus TaxID=284029 RepID=A0ABP5XEJ8_9ACTN
MTATPTATVGLCPGRGATEVSVPRRDPVLWGAPDAPGPIRRPPSCRTSATASSASAG